MLYGAGLRRSEAVAVPVTAYRSAAGELLVPGKGRKERIVPIINGTADALNAWIAVRGDQPGPLLLPVRKGGQILLSSMSPQAVLVILLKRAEQAAIHDVSPHDLRRSFGTHLLDAGADVFSVQKLMGHANVATTQRYDRRDERAKRTAIQMLHIPI
jgi:site-specific recombinase XerD